MSERVAIFVVNYNMPERTDALCEHIAAHESYPHELIVIDNGSDDQPPSRFTSLRLSQNVQTTGGWLMGVEYARWLARVKKENFCAYWFLITSAQFAGDGEILPSLVGILDKDPTAVAAHPALTADSTTSWGHLIDRGSGAPRRTWHVDNIASLYLARWFDKYEPFDPGLTFAWGIDLEACYLARSQNRSIYIHEGVHIRKDTDIGYQMGRMNMAANSRKALASVEMKKVLGRKYGFNWWEIMTDQFVTEELR